MILYIVSFSKKDTRFFIRNTLCRDATEAQGAPKMSEIERGGN